MESASLLQSIQHFETFMAFFMVLALVPVFRRFAPMVGLVDHPGGRKKHAAPVPLVGGVAIYTAFMATVLFNGLYTGFEGLIFGSSTLFLLGLIDDRFDISAALRFVLQAIIISIALSLDSIWLTSLGNFWGVEFSLGILSYPITVLAILGVINAINMLDGLDGLVSGVVMLILFFTLGTASINNNAIAPYTTTLLGAVVGFWLYNYRFPWREKASVFMGDSGTNLLGFILPYLAIHLTIASATNNPIKPAYILWLFALPLWDISAVVLKRIKEGKSPLNAGRDHIHHILLNHGLNVRQAVLFIYGITALSLSLGTSLVYFQFGAVGLYLSFAFALYLYVERLFKYDRKESMAKVVELKPSTEKKFNTNA